MKRPHIRIALAATLLGCSWLLTGCAPQAEPDPSISLDSGRRSPDFAVAAGPLEFNPRLDHGPHFEFQTEWWYYTGNLESESGDRYGYQLTLFRRGMSPGLDRRPAWFASNQIYFAHLALTDASLGEHRAFERFSRGVDGLAGASGDPFQVYLEEWSVVALDPDGSSIRLQAGEQDIALDLRLQADQPLVAHGPGGLSPKGVGSTDATYYFSFTALHTEGTLSVRGEQLEVHGSSWFDHEWGSRVLPPGAAGWDWFGLQLDDGRELMLYQVRAGQDVLVSGGTLVGQDGRAVWLTPADFEIEALGTWSSRASDSEYPSGWRIVLHDEQLELELQPLIADQENRLSIVYWEGAVDVLGTVSGRGYVELTGYQASLQPWF
ncbi:MAG: lipocalin-like domain-containing protein [Anaerolineales bacterium]